MVNFEYSKESQRMLDEQQAQFKADRDDQKMQDRIMLTCILLLYGGLPVLLIIALLLSSK